MIKLQSTVSFLTKKQPSCPSQFTAQPVSLLKTKSNGLEIQLRQNVKRPGNAAGLVLSSV